MSTEQPWSNPRKKLIENVTPIDKIDSTSTEPYPVNLQVSPEAKEKCTCGGATINFTYRESTIEGYLGAKIAGDLCALCTRSKL